MQVALDGVDNVFFAAHPAAIDCLHHTFADFGQERFCFFGGDKSTGEDLGFVK